MERHRHGDGTHAGRRHGVRRRGAGRARVRDVGAPLGDGRNRGSVAFTFGPAQAAALYAGNNPAGGAVAIPVQVDTLAQGHRGLGYVLSLSVTGGIFGAADLVTYPVASAAACTTALTGPGASSSTPWPAAYSASTTVLTEYWCLVARYVPTRWAHTDTATATAPNPLVPGTPAGAGLLVRDRPADLRPGRRADARPHLHLHLVPAGRCTVIRGARALATVALASRAPC